MSVLKNIERVNDILKSKLKFKRIPFQVFIDAIASETLLWPVNNEDAEFFIIRLFHALNEGFLTLFIGWPLF